LVGKVARRFHHRGRAEHREERAGEERKYCVRGLVLLTKRLADNVGVPAWVLKRRPTRQKMLHGELASGGWSEQTLLEDGFDFVDGDGAFAEDLPVFVVDADDGGGQASAGFARVEDEREAKA